MDEERKQPIADTPELSDTASSAEEQAALPPDGETADDNDLAIWIAFVCPGSNRCCGAV